MSNNCSQLKLAVAGDSALCNRRLQPSEGSQPSAENDVSLATDGFSRLQTSTQPIAENDSTSALDDRRELKLSVADNAELQPSAEYINHTLKCAVANGRGWVQFL